MNNIILSHLRAQHDFRNLACLLETKITEEFFVIEDEELLFFNELVHIKQGCLFKTEKEGYWITYYHNGQKETEGWFKQGKRHGCHIIYLETGEKYKEEKYDSKGEMIFSIHYYKTGEEESRCSYSNGKIDGFLTRYFQNGDMKLVYSYQDGEKHGDFAYYRFNGQKEMMGKFHHGKKVGVWEYWDLDKNLTKIDFDKINILEAIGKLTFVFSSMCLVVSISILSKRR